MNTNFPSSPGADHERNPDVFAGSFRKFSFFEEMPYELLLVADETIEAIDRYVFDSEIYVYELEGQMIGLYVLYPLNDRESEIKNIAVTPGFQGKGVGSLLLRHAVDVALHRGFSRIIIGTGDVLHRQIALYQRMGFEIYDRKKDFYLKNYPSPIYEGSAQLIDMVMLKLDLKE
jgi:GNAT superfamily N-acetyltransferase